jgi:hypothetical protein
MYRRRRLTIGLTVSLLAVAVTTLGAIRQQAEQAPAPSPQQVQPGTASPAGDALRLVSIKGRAPKTGYVRTQFSNGWQDLGSCDVRNYILARDMDSEVLQSPTDCTVISGTLQDPYTAKTIAFVRGSSSSSKVQIDHVVALSDAWQKGAQQLSPTSRYQLANDPLNLLAVDGQANNNKSDGDAATWLPPNKNYRCQYVARQIAVKRKYSLWITQAEHDAMQRILGDCPDQQLPMVIPMQ